MEPLVSVVMPIYNRAYCVMDAIRSVTDQTYQNWELWVVDDGSDDSEQLVRKLQGFDDKRIHYVRIPHSGNISKVRNYGNSRGIGKYIVVHDSDDMAYPNRLEEIVKVFQRSPDVDVVYHGMYIRAHDEQNNAVARVWKPAQPYQKGRLLKEQYIMGQVAYKRSVWNEIPYDGDFALMDDWVFLLDLELNNKTFECLDKDVYEYVALNDSVNISGEESGQRARDTEKLITKLKNRYGIEATATMHRHALPLKKKV